MKIEIHLPWPPKELSPNARLHHMAKARAAKKYRVDCWALSVKVLAGRSDWRRYPGRFHLWITFEPPDRRKRDDDNVTAAFKNGRDGLADALGVDDSRFIAHPFLSESVHKGGRVKIVITDGPDPNDSEWQWGDPWPGE